MPKSSYDWPGNVRELRNEVERMAALVENGQRISSWLLSDRLRKNQSLPTMTEGEALMDTLERIKEKIIEDALRKCDGNRTQAAKLLRISRPSLHQMMKRLGIT